MAKARRTAEQLQEDCREAIGLLGGGELLSNSVARHWFSASARMAKGRSIHIYGAETAQDALEQLLIVLLLRIEQGYAA